LSSNFCLLLLLLFWCVLSRCQLSALRPQELANLAWAVAKTGHQVHEGWSAELLQCSSRYMSPGSSSSSSSSGVQASRSAAAVGWPSGAGLHTQHLHQNKQQQQGLAGVSAECFQPQELANVAWALAVMQQQCMLHSAPPLRHSCTRVDAAWKQQLCAAAAAQRSKFNAADLSMVMWALTVLGGGHVLLQQQQPSWLDGQLGRAVQLAGSMQGRHIAMLLWSVSQLQRQQQHLQQQQAQQTSRSISGECIAAACPSADGSSSSSALQAFAGACFPRLQQLLPSEQQQLQLCCVVLLSCGHLQLQPPPAVMQGLLAAAGSQLQQQSAASWSTMRQQYLSAGSSIERRPAADTAGARQWLSNNQQQQQQQQQGVSLHDVTILLYGLAKLQYRPSGHFLAAADQAAATACWQLLLGNRHRKLRQQQQQQQQGQLHQQYSDVRSSSSSAAAAAARPGPPSHVRVKDISLLLWAIAKLRHTPSPKLLRLLCKAAAARLHAANAMDVGMMLWRLARLRARPRHSWLQVYLAHFLAHLDDSVHAAPAICHVVYALPHLPGGKLGRKLNQMLVERLSEGQQLQQLAGAACVRFEECGARELVALLQGFAKLGFSPGAGWLAEHQQRCEALGWENFSDREQHLLRRSREVLAQL
jgi:hypothetical protein